MGHHRSARDRKRAGTSRPAGQHKSVREEKRARFSQTSGRRKLPVLPLVLPGVVLLAVAVLLWRPWAGSNGSPSAGGVLTQIPVAQPPSVGGDPTGSAAQSDAIRLPLSTFEDGLAHFYSYDIGGTLVEFFVLKSSDGVVRAAFNACDVCYPAHKGYHQEGDEMVCNNCGRRFPSRLINEVSGGCNPVPLTRTVEGSDLLIRLDDLAAGVGYFK